MDRIEIPSDFSALSLDALTEFQTNARTAFTTLKGDRAPEQFSDEEVAYMTALGNGVQAAVAEAGKRQTAASERIAQIEAAAGIIAASSTEPATPAEPTAPAEPAAPADPAATPDAPTETPAPETDAPTEGVQASATPPAVNVTVQMPENFAEQVADLVVTRGGGGVARVAAGRRSPVTPAATRRTGGAQILSARNVINIDPGQAYADMGQVAQAFEAIAETFPKTATGPGLQQRNRTATFSRGIDAFEGFDTDNKDFADHQALLDGLTREGRLPGGSLVAAGGWCAPSETLYDLCSNESLDGLVSLPEMRITRGGIRFTTGPDFSTIYTSAGFCQTEAQAIAGTTKPCVEVPCPDFEEVRLDACGLCVRAPILTNSGYPELVRRWIDGTFIAHRHKVNARTIASMATALAAAPQLVTGLGSAASDTLNALELAAEGIRQKYRMAFNESLEVILPHWMLAIMRADLALRQGRTETEAVSDEELRAYFTRRKLAVQFVYDWQDLAYPDTDPGAPVVPGCVVAYPATVEALIYPAGTFVRGTNDVINLDTVYDTTSLQANMYTAAFFEEGILVAQVCFSGCRLTIPLCVSGKTGAANIDACPVEAA